MSAAPVRRYGAETVAAWLAEGSLLHPVADNPSFVDLVRYLAMLSGADQFPETAGIERLRALIEPSDVILMVVVDGLGLNLTRHFPPGGFFEKYLKQELRAIFPSTTACALTTLASGAWPAEHGLTGWWTHFPEIQRTLSPLRFLERFTEMPGRRLGLHLAELINAKSMYPRFMRQTATFVPRHVSRGEYPNWSRGGAKSVAYRTYDQLVKRMTRYVRSSSRPGYIYLYTLDVDSTEHKSGTQSEKVAAAVAANDALLTELRASLPDAVRMVVTADHGLIDVPRTSITVLSDDLPLSRYLVVPPSAEGTTPVFHVADGKREEFVRAFEDSGLGERYALLTPDEAEALQIYGPGPLSQPARRHLGDFIGISRDPNVVEYVKAGSRPLLHLASHGGMRADEMRTPLFIA